MTACVWGFAFVAQAESDLGVLWFNGIRFVIGSLSLVPVALVFERGRPDRAGLRALLRWSVPAGLMLFAASTLQMWGIALGKSSGKAGFITGFYMVLVPVYAALFLRRKLTFRSMAGAVVALAGLFMVSFSNGIEPPEPGDLLVLAGAFVWPIHILILDRVPESVKPLTFCSVQFATVGAVSLILAPLLESGIAVNAGTLRANLWPILYCGIVSSGIGYTGQAVGQRGCEPGLASIIMCAESVFAAIGGMLFMHENLGWIGYAGCALILAGIVIVQIGPRGPKRGSPDAETPPAADAPPAAETPSERTDARPYQDGE